MKRQKLFLKIILVVIGLALILPAGCAKKEIVKEEPAVQTQAPVQSQETGKEKATEEQLTKERAAKEKALAEMAAKEKAKEEAMAEAAAKVKKEASRFADIHFAFDRFDLRQDAREILDMHAKWLTKHTEYVLRIEGNCDERGTVEYNLALGNRRANSAMKYLVDRGVDTKRISTISYGKERPLDPGHNEEAWAKNRRDHFVVTLIK
jgi:peptidoglycan-associated lipoprotein